MKDFAQNGVGFLKINGENVCNGIAKPLEQENTFQNGTVADTCPLLNHIISKSGVHDKIAIKNKPKVEKILQEIVSGGPDSLQVILDFDATLSCYHAKGKRCSTSYGSITFSHLIPEEVRARGQTLFNEYHPFENDHSISFEERAAKLEEWYKKKHDNYVQGNLKFKESQIAEVIQKAHIVLREGSHKVLKTLHASNIPTLIFSAGSGDSINVVLKANEVNLPNIKVIANFMKFDETTNEFDGFRLPTIHPGNKNSSVLKNEPYFDSLCGRHNAIVLGDNVGDAVMATGMPNQEAILKIGFLNFKIEEQLESYKGEFDIVLIDDQSFFLMDALLDLILKKSCLKLLSK